MIELDKTSIIYIIYLYMADILELGDRDLYPLRADDQYGRLLDDGWCFFGNDRQPLSGGDVLAGFIGPGFEVISVPAAYEEGNPALRPLQNLHGVFYRPKDKTRIPEAVMAAYIAKVTGQGGNPKIL